MTHKCLEKLPVWWGHLTTGLSLHEGNIGEYQVKICFVNMEQHPESAASEQKFTFLSQKLTFKIKAASFFFLIFVYVNYCSLCNCSVFIPIICSVFHGPLKLVQNYCVEKICLNIHRLHLLLIVKDMFHRLVLIVASHVLFIWFCHLSQHICQPIARLICQQKLDNIWLWILCLVL